MDTGWSGRFSASWRASSIAPVWARARPSAMRWRGTGSVRDSDSFDGRWFTLISPRACPSSTSTASRSSASARRNVASFWIGTASPARFVNSAIAAARRSASAATSGDAISASAERSRWISAKW